MSLKVSSCPLFICEARISIGDPVWCWWVFLLFSFFYLSSLKNCNLALLVVGISTSILIFLISNFLSWSFSRSFICFQFHHSISIYQILYFLMWSSFFRILIFILSLFVKILVFFNFITQFKLMVLYFLIWLSLFWFLIFFLGHFIKVIIIFNFTF
jgi:hypothetical protein